MKSRDQQLLEEAYESIVGRTQTNWGSAEQPYWYPGPNPTVDLVIVYDNKILLIKRAKDSNSEPNKWAIPGGFIDTSAKKGEPFKMDRELPKQAALREVEEETGTKLTSTPNIKSRMREVGVYEGDQRDPRDSKDAWSRSHAFALKLTDKDGVDIKSARGLDDASEAHWFDVDDLPSELAFDHRRIIRDALIKLSNPNWLQQESLEDFEDFETIDSASDVINIVTNAGYSRTENRGIEFINAIRKAIELIAKKKDLDKSMQFSVLKELLDSEYITNEQYAALKKVFKPTSFFGLF